MLVFISNWYFKDNISDEKMINYLTRFFDAQTIDELGNFKLFWFGQFLRKTITNFYVDRLIQILPMLDQAAKINFTAKLDSHVIRAIYETQHDVVPLSVLKIKLPDVFKTDDEKKDHDSILSSSDQTNRNKYINLHFDQLSYKTILQYTDDVDIILKLIFDPAKFTDLDVPGFKKGDTYDKLLGYALEDPEHCLYKVKQYDFPKIRFLFVIELFERTNNERLYTALQLAYAKYEEL